MAREEKGMLGKDSCFGGSCQVRGQSGRDQELQYVYILVDSSDTAKSLFINPIHSIRFLFAEGFRPALQTLTRVGFGGRRKKKILGTVGVGIAGEGQSNRFALLSTPRSHRMDDNVTRLCLLSLHCNVISWRRDLVSTHAAVFGFDVATPRVAIRLRCFPLPPQPPQLLASHCDFRRIFCCAAVDVLLCIFA